MLYGLLILIILALGIYIVEQRKELKIKLKAAADNGVGEFLISLISQGTISRLEWFNFLNKSAEKGGILFVGDSLTQEFLLEEYFADKLVYNRGIGGDTTEGLLKRMDESIYALNPSKMFLLIGTNDLAINISGPDKIVENIKSIIIKTKERCRDTAIYVESLYPTATTGYNDLSEEALRNRANYAIDIINEKLEVLCKQLEVNYININRKLKDEEGKLKLEYTRDGLHLNPNGYEIVIDCLKNYM